MPYNTKRSEIFKIHAANFDVGSASMNIAFHELSSVLKLFWLLYSSLRVLFAFFPELLSGYS